MLLIITVKSQPCSLAQGSSRPAHAAGEARRANGHPLTVLIKECAGQGAPSAQQRLIWKTWVISAFRGHISRGITFTGASLVSQAVNNLPAMQETWVRSLGLEDPLRKGTATHSSILAWRIPWTRAWRDIVHWVTKGGTQLKQLTQHIDWLPRWH